MTEPGHDSEAHMIETRLASALAAMRAPPVIDRGAAARIAAQAVLANAPSRSANRWGMRAAAALAVVTLGALAMGTRNPAGTSTRTVPVAAAPVMLQSAPSASSTRLVARSGIAARPIMFELDAPGARTVQVIGDFNDWSRNASSMQRGTDGRWRVTTLLPPGRYVYAFLIDGERFQRDLRRDPIEDRDFGVTGSELVIGEAP